MNPWRGLGGLPASVWLICAADFINRAGTMALVFLVPWLTQDRGWSVGMASAAIAVYGTSRMVCGLVTGPLIDKVGAVRVLNVSLFGVGATLVSFPLFVPPPAVMFIQLAAWGGFAQATGPACMALLAGVAPSAQRRGVFALQRMGANVGMTIGPAIGGFLAHVNYDWVFWGNGMTALAAGVFVSLRLRDMFRDTATDKRSPSRRAWEDRRLLALLVSVLPALLVFFQTEGTVSLRVIGDLKLDTRVLGFIFTLNTLLIVFVEVPLNLAMSKWPQRHSFMLGALCLAAGFGGLGLADGVVGLAVCVVVWTFGEMILLPTLSDAVAELAPADRRGEYMGVLSLAYSMGLAAGPALGLQVYEHLGSPATWIGCFGLGISSVVLLGALRQSTAAKNPIVSDSTAAAASASAESPR